MGGMVMNKLAFSLCAAGLFFCIALAVKAEEPDYAEVWGIIPGECVLDGVISPPHKSIDDMDGFEVPLVANWSPAKQNEIAAYGGDAKFGVSNFKIGNGELIDAYTVGIDLTMDNPELSEAQKDTLLIYSCEDVSESCTATLVTVKAAITEQIARDHEAEVGDVVYESDASANLLGVFVRGANRSGKGTVSAKGHISILTEVCGTYEITLAGAFTTE
jgi:hypothetical protein